VRFGDDKVAYSSVKHTAAAAAAAAAASIYHAWARHVPGLT